MLKVLKLAGLAIAFSLILFSFFLNFIILKPIKKLAKAAENVDADVKSEPSDSWGGHVLVGIYIPGHSGESFSLSGDSKPYYIAETTIWEDGYDGIGINWWHDMTNITTYAVN